MRQDRRSNIIVPERRRRERIPMPKAVFTQCACVLFESAPEFARVKEALARFNVVGEKTEGEEEGGWALSGPSVLVSMEPEAKGVLVVDVVPRVWPDSLGDGEQGSNLRIAVAMGHFGPHTAPQCLARATQHSWTWEEGAAAAERHGAFVRIRSSYVVGPNAKNTGGPEGVELVPAGYDPVVELLCVTEVASALGELAGALAYFNPTGEVLRAPSALKAALAECNAQGVPPLDLWANVRLYDLGGTDWTLMDTVGMSQLDSGDHEACFAGGRYAFEAVDGFLRDTTYSELVAKTPIRPGDAIDGPPEGGSASSPWQGVGVFPSIGAPRRNVQRWLPLDGRTSPERIAKRQ